VHDVGVTLDLHATNELDASGDGDAPDVVPAEVDQHDVFRELLDIGGELPLQENVLCFRLTARPSTGDRAHRHDAAFEAHAGFGAGAEDLRSSLLLSLLSKGGRKVEEVHVRGRIDDAQRTVDREGVAPARRHVK
jgi:hypothetical protein